MQTQDTSNEIEIWKSMVVTCGMKVGSVKRRASVESWKLKVEDL